MSYTGVEHTKPEEAAVNETTVEAPVDTEDIKYTLTATNRCDSGSCGAQGYVITKHTSGTLVWCAHHFNKHALALLPFVVLDKREDLVWDRAKGEAHA